MGKRGPKPKPVLIRKLEGNPGRLPMPEPELEITCELPPVKPDLIALDDLASAEWDRVVRAMPAALYTAADVAVLTMYANAWSLMHRAQDDINEHGTLILEEIFNSDTGQTTIKYKANPAVGIWKSATETLLKTVDRLGLCPGVRARMQIPGRNEKPQSKFSGLMPRN